MSSPDKRFLTSVDIEGLTRVKIYTAPNFKNAYLQLMEEYPDCKFKYMREMDSNSDYILTAGILREKMHW